MKRFRKLAIAQILIAETKGVHLIKEDEDGYHYQAGGLVVRIKPGGTIAVKDGDGWKTLDVGVPQDIIDLQDGNMKDFHTSLSGWLSDSRAFSKES